jgi:gliding motility-associated-like protein
MLKLLRKYVSIQLTLLLILLVSAPNVQGQLLISGGQTAAQLVQKLVGVGVTISNQTLTCASNANGVFIGTSNIGLDSGIIMTSGQASTTLTVPGANGASSLGASTQNSQPGDAQLTAIGGQPTFDACILEFDFLPQGDTIKFDYVFSSEEYENFSCSPWNDVFGFFISGPGITGAKNLAVVPNTTIPITVNSTTNPSLNNNPPLGLCNAMGPGSPFSIYYIDNPTGTTVTHSGFTSVFTAVSQVIPCQQYHLKLAIADGSDYILDSGVWLKAGSLTSNNIKIQPFGGGGLTKPEPYCVRGCLAGQFTFSRPVGLPTPLTIKYQITGTAVNGVDYTLIPDSVVIPSGQKTAQRIINPVAIFPATGPKKVKLRVFNPYSCSTQQIIDSAEITIYDSIYVKILNNDTSICVGNTVNLDAECDPILTYQWGPAGSGIANPNVLNTTATPGSSVLYEIAASLPGSGCPTAHDYMQVWVRTEPEVHAGRDTTTCLGTPFQFNVQCIPTNQPYTYTWTPATGLSSTTVANPSANPNATTTYYIAVNPGAIGCDGHDTVTLRILPNDIELFNHDTAICRGETIVTNVAGDPNFTYSWTPTNGIKKPFVIMPDITPDTSATYVVTARFPGCPDMVHQFDVDVQPVPVVTSGADRDVCQWDIVILHGTVSPEWYKKYDISWEPNTHVITNPKEKDIVFYGMTTTDMVLVVKTPAGCTGTDTTNIVVYPGDFGTVTPDGDQRICPNDTLELVATGGAKYQWSPDLDVSATNKATVKVYPTNSTWLNLLITDIHGCKDTFDIRLTVNPEAIVDLPADIKLHPGESVMLNPGGNCIHYSWFPPVGLSDASIANPIAKPEVNTRYIYTAVTESGCEVTDSINVWMVPTQLDMPNAFAPDGRSNNNLKIIKQGIATLKYFRIFNRWGVKVFETSNIDEGWDGTINGESQPMGVYVYSIEAITDNGTPYSKQGNITLIR